MNIFIYGNASFKSDIHKVFKHSNIKFKLAQSDSIQEINTLIELRTAIENYPKDIFLIDDAKIFKKNALNQKIKFLKPNDAVEEEFINEHGISDVSINSLEELPNYIIERIEESKTDMINDDYHNSNENFDIQESIISIVDEAYSQDNIADEKTSSANISNLDVDNDKIQLDDELSNLLAFEENEENDEQEELKEEDFKNDIVNITDEDEKKTYTQEVISDADNAERENMLDEFSELDNLNENDILVALDGLEDIDINSVMPVEAKTENQNNNTQVQNNLGLEMNSSNVNDIVSILSTLLNNKTLEITIKVKE